MLYVRDKYTVYNSSNKSHDKQQLPASYSYLNRTVSPRFSFLFLFTMTISNDEATLQKMLSTMETLRADQLRLAEQVKHLLEKRMHS
jgi:hypothetical protein